MPVIIKTTFKCGHTDTTEPAPGERVEGTVSVEDESCCSALCKKAMAAAKKAAERKAKEGDAGGFLSVPQSQHSEYLPAYEKKPSGGK